MYMEFVKICIALMAMVNPISTIPIFLSLTQDNSKAERKKIAFTAATATLTTIIFFAFFGNSVLSLLGISIGAFRVGGGILLLLIAISMLNAQPNPTKKSTAEERSEAENKDSIAVVPLAIPLLVGPGTISTIIIYASSVQKPLDYLPIMTACVVVSVICLCAMLSAASLANFLGKTGINIINRIMGMLLAALSIEIMTDGIKAIFPSLG